MAKPEKKPHRKRNGSSPSYFLGCFGFSRKKFPEKPIPSPDGGERKKKKKKENQWFSWSKFASKNGEIKPFPIKETDKPKESDKQETVPVISRMTYRKNIPAVDKSAKPETETRNTNTISDRSEPLDPASPSNSDTCHKRVPTCIREKPDPTRSGQIGSDPDEADRVGKFDPVVGIVIITVTLAIMLICGRICAILCASACCYFLPRLRDAAAKRKCCCGGEESVLVSDVVDLNS